MFSNLGQNSILHVFDINGSPKVLSGPIERVTPPRPKYNSFSPMFETVVDIIANINGERREFKGVPNGSIADFGDDSFVLAESKDALNSYISSMLQNSKNVINSIEKHEKRIPIYEEALEEINPTLKANREKDEALQTLQEQVNSLQDGMKQLLAKLSDEEKPKL